MTTNRRTFLRCTTWAPLFFLTLGVISWAIFTAFTSAPVHWEQGTSDGIMSLRDNAKGSPAAVYAAHADTCWTMGDTAKAQLPSAAIIQKVGGGAVYTTNPKMVTSALNEVLSDIGYGSYEDDSIRVVALCI